jgi:hypothetical protein
LSGVTTFTEEMALTICERLANGESLKAICTSDDMPARSTVFKWLAENKTFSDMYARAREEQAEFMADEIVSIADGQTTDSDVQRDRLRIDARKWVAAKLLPRKYGDKLELEHGGKIELTPVINFNANKG